MICEAEPEHDFLPRLVTTPRATAYLKIAEGCDHPCTFCIIPTLRGKFRSRSAESICAEARALVAGGAKELILIAQDTSMWGRDRGMRRGGLAQLLERLHEIDGLEWIRLLYLYPATVDRELIDAIARLPKVCKYMDMPLQHAHPDVLRAMRRPSNGERYLELIDEFRARVPGITMRSTFIVGFPGETDEHVAYLEEWIRRAQLDRVGFFEYSAEEGTPAARLADRVGARRRRQRLIRLREAQRLASERARSKRCGTTVRVLVEESRRLRERDEFAPATWENPEHGLDARRVKRPRLMAVFISPARPAWATSRRAARRTRPIRFLRQSDTGGARGRLTKRILTIAGIVAIGLVSTLVGYAVFEHKNPVTAITQIFVPAPQQVVRQEQPARARRGSRLRLHGQG